MKTGERGFILPLVLIIVAILAVGGGVYYIKKAKQAQHIKQEAVITATVQPTETHTDTHTAPVPQNTLAAAAILTSVKANVSVPTPAKLDGTLGILLSGNGKNQKCTYTGTSDFSNDSGTIYLGDATVRADIQSTISGRLTDAHLIKVGTDVYVWNGTQGTKMAWVDFASQMKVGVSQSALLPNYNQKIQYSCIEWTPTASMFTPPSTVSFMDMSVIMNQILNGQFKGNY